MARRRDRDFEDDDDDDRYDRRSRSSGSKTVLIILGVFGGIFLLICVTCAGLFIYGVNQAKKAIALVVDTDRAGDTFFRDLSSGRVDEAYASTSASYKTKTSRQQFDEILKKYPILKTHQVHRQIMPGIPAGSAGKMTATMSYELFENVADMMALDADADDDDDEPAGKAKPKTKTKPAADPKTKETNQSKGKLVRVTIVEENGKWTIDQLDIP
ncbi:MAG: hypothetical protein U0798_04190 [Gemmataceae bacterium]